MPNGLTEAAVGSSAGFSITLQLEAANEQWVPEINDTTLRQVFARAQDAEHDGHSAGFFDGPQHQSCKTPRHLEPTRPCASRLLTFAVSRPTLTPPDVRGLSPSHRGVYAGVVLESWQGWREPYSGLRFPPAGTSQLSPPPPLYKLTSPRSQGTLANIFSRPATATGPVLAWACISITWKELPTNFFRKKMSGSRDRKFCLENAFFFRCARRRPPIE